MQHHFNTEIAKKYDIVTAVILDNLFYWIEKNRANNKNFVDGRYWTYNSKKAMSELFPYLTPRQLDYATKKMQDNGIILIANHNTDKSDRTLWYAITDYGYSILQNCSTILQNCEMYNNINNTNTKTNKKEINKEKEFVAPTYDEITAYAVERNRLDLVDKFYNYYEASGWKDNKGKKVNNWKLKFVTWENNNPKTSERTKIDRSSQQVL